MIPLGIRSFLRRSQGVISLNATTCRVDDLNSSLVYSVRIRCVTSKKCPQCAVSEAYTVPPGQIVLSLYCFQVNTTSKHRLYLLKKRLLSELTSQPLIVDLQDTDIEGRRGSRLLSLTWKVIFQIAFFLLPREEERRLPRHSRHSRHGLFV